jgi:hypothetical protein
MYLFVAIVAFEEIIALRLAAGSGVEVVVETVFDLSQQEIARVDFTINAELRVRHQLYIISTDIT